MNALRGILAVGVVAVTAGTIAGAAQAAEEVNVYSYRQPFLIEPVLDKFTEQTGIKANVIFAKKGLLERMEQEGANSPADVLLTTSGDVLVDARQAGLTQPVDSDTLEGNIPAQFRHPDGHWFALTKRARVIVTSKERVPEGAITTYQDLADPKWDDRVCTRSGTHVYQIGLLSSMIAEKGRDEAKAWLAGLKDNLARKPQGNDRAQAKAIKEGECDIALINSYYYGKMLQNEEQVPWAEAIRVILPNQGEDQRGTHVNITGMALAKNAPHKDNAVKLMEFLSSDTAQQIYAQQNYEYPIKDGVAWADMLKGWGEFKTESVDWETVAAKRDEAIKVTNEVGYNE